MAFYAVPPLLAYLLVVVLCGDRWRPARLLAGLAGLAAISLGWQVVLVTTDWLPNSAGMWPPAHLASFAVGMGLAVLAEAGGALPGDGDAAARVRRLPAGLHAGGRRGGDGPGAGLGSR